MLPFYSVFDNLQYRVDGAKVTLLGQVNTPTLKSDAEYAVKHIEGVETVDNQLEVLPTSPFDDRIRSADVSVHLLVREPADVCSAQRAADSHHRQ